ncbi:RNA polymerase II transcription factor B subunit 4 [Pseudocyphellaria aurata]|nr:RNA polymerase II transcription factor B subunit 4 [Pseudocyphellaria aurata]
MDAVDGSEHHAKSADGPPPSLLTVILDTNPNAWALLADTLPLSRAIANLLVFVNAHLACNHANNVAIIASHTQRAEFLYPASPKRTSTDGRHSSHHQGPLDSMDSDGEMGDHISLETSVSTNDANKYRPFRMIQETLVASLSNLLRNTSQSSLPTTPTTSIAGALTLALTYTNKQSLLHSLPSSTSTTDPSPISTHPMLSSRILILSVSGDLANQYIPIMNTIFACQRLNIPIDIAKIAGDTVFLQQASDATRGTYIKLEHPKGLLQYLMMAYLPDQTSRRYLVSPTQVGVDFRAACFCHRNVVDVGFVCTICLSIFCSPPEGAICLTCGMALRLGDYGRNPAVVRKKKKKRRQRAEE